MNKTGFGFLRLPRLDPDDEKSIDFDLLCSMVDRFLEKGGDYFDTAYTYLGGKSEEALRRTLVERYPRERFRIADKLPGYEASSREDNRRFLEESLRRCGVDYFDVYLLHGLNEENYAIAQKYDQFSFLQELKASGRAGKIGFSYHDGPELLDRILSSHPEMDIVQLQINYLDWNSVSIQAKKCYEVAVKHGKTVVVMEPVKGGSLANLPREAEQHLRALRQEESMASWAIRFAADLDQAEVVLSGMNTMAQIEDNMRALSPLTDTEREALEQCARIIRSNTAVPCTGCGYCSSHCPVQIPIPQYFALYNEYARNPGEDWKMQYAFDALGKKHGKAGDCIGCRSCERYCPQKIEIAEQLKKVQQVFSAW